MNNGLYVYGIGRNDSRFGIHDPIATMAPDHPLMSVDNGQLAALVSEVPLDEFSHNALAKNLRDLVWLERAARTHDSVIRQLSTFSTILPVRFGTVFFTTESVRQFLSRAQEEICSLLSDLEGVWEMGVTLQFDSTQIIENLSSRNPEITRLKDKINLTGSGTAYLLKRKLEALQESLLNSFVEMQVSTFATVLATLARQVRQSNTVVLPENQSRYHTNIACLVSKERLDSFQECVASMASSLDVEGITVRTTGPWPPYSFSYLGNELAMAV